MIKILSAEQIREADRFTIQHEPVASIDLMGRASMAFTAWFVNRFSPAHMVHIFCGTGNNGGDGLAVARLLSEKTYKVNVYIVGDPVNGSEDFKINHSRLQETCLIKTIDDLPETKKDDIIIDAIFGSGLSRSVTGLYEEVISSLNQLSSIKLAIDIPSGLFADLPSEGTVFKAGHTISFQLPKLAFLLPENGPYVGEWHVADIGLHEDIIREQLTPYFTLSRSFINEQIRPRGKYDHKGTYGRALIMAGSYGKMGAAVLAARAAMRCGTGLLTLYVPRCGYQIVQTAVPEAMVITDERDNELSELPVLNAYNSIGIGPGLGKSTYTLSSLKKLLTTVDTPLIIDADALNLISEHRELLQIIPAGSVLTPHPIEFKRLVGEWKDDFERLELQKAFSHKHSVVILLKGAHTSVSTPSGEVYFNVTGNPGMATAGSGDVLTGMITALCAQGYSSEVASMIGVYVHGLAGDIASEEKSTIGLIASDIIEKIPAAFKKIHE